MIDTHRLPSAYAARSASLFVFGKQFSSGKNTRRLRFLVTCILNHIGLLFAQNGEFLLRVSIAVIAVIGPKSVRLFASPTHAVKMTQVTIIAVFAGG